MSIDTVGCKLMASLDMSNALAVAAILCYARSGEAKDLQRAIYVAGLANGLHGALEAIEGDILPENDARDIADDLGMGRMDNFGKPDGIKDMDMIGCYKTGFMFAECFREADLPKTPTEYVCSVCAHKRTRGAT